MAEQKYEYVAVKAPPGLGTKTSEQLLTSKLNDVAEHGWRYCGYEPAGSHLIFERPFNE